MVEEVIQQNSPEETAPEILASNPSTEAAGQPAEPQADTPALVVESPDPLSLVKDFLGKEQGRLAQVSGQKIAAFQQSVKAELDGMKESFKPLLQQAQQVERERLLNMGTDELADMVMQKNTATAEPAQTEQALSPTLAALATATQELVAESNLNISLEDPNLWEGWNNSMSVAKSIEIAKQNIDKMSGKTQVAQQQTNVQQQTAQPAPPSTAPTTQGAPQKSNRTISSRSELAEMFAAGRITSGQYRTGKDQLRTSGTVSF
jgi:hypothetical protein